MILIILKKNHLHMSMLNPNEKWVFCVDDCNQSWAIANLRCRQTKQRIVAEWVTHLEMAIL